MKNANLTLTNKKLTNSLPVLAGDLEVQLAYLKQIARVSQYAFGFKLIRTRKMLNFNLAGDDCSLFSGTLDIVLWKKPAPTITLKTVDSNGTQNGSIEITGKWIQTFTDPVNDGIDLFSYSFCYRKTGSRKPLSLFLMLTSTDAGTMTGVLEAILNSNLPSTPH